MRFYRRDDIGRLFVKPLLLIAISLFMTACATSGPETAQSEAVQAVESNAGEMVAQNGVEGSAALDAGENPEAVASTASAGDELVCERVKPTGSRIAVKRCRTRAQIEEAERINQEMLRRGQRMDRIALDP